MMRRTETPLYRRIGSLLLALVMLWTLMPEFTVKAYADGGSAPASLSFAMGMNGVQDYMENGDGTYDYVEYGGLKWRVLDTESDAGTGTGILLLSENVLNYGQPWNGYRMYSDRNGTPGATDGDTKLGYSVSDVRAYLVGDASHTYTKFRTGTALNTSEVANTIPSYYYYRIEQAPGSYVQPGQLYYTRDAADDAGYVQYADLTELLFSQGSFYTLDGGAYTKAAAFTAGTDYYYDVSEYSLADLGDAQQLPTDQAYYSFARASSAKASSTDSSKALGTLYYIGYHTTGEGRPRSSSVTRTIVSGKTGADVNFTSDYGFTPTELGAVMNTVKETPYTSSSTYHAGAYTYYGGSLVGDSFFLLSADEANNPGYGFTDNTSRIGKDLAGNARYWWLRSSRNVSYPGYVLTSGSFSNDRATTTYVGLRPAFNFNRASVIFASAAAGGKSSAAPGGVINRGEAAENFWKNPAPAGTNDWKLTYLDGSLSVSADKLTKYDDGTYTLEYSGASDCGEGVYLSAVLLEGSEAVSYGYGRLLAIDSAEAQSGEISFKLPAGLDLTNCNIKFFLEQCQDGSTACDLASQPVPAAVIEDSGHEYEDEWQQNGTHHWHVDKGTGEKIDEAEHDFTDWVDDRASCDEAGTRSRHCTVCGHEEKENLPAGSHTWENKVEAVEPNCTTPGSYAYYTCSACGKYGRVDGVDEHDAEIISVHTDLQDMQRGALGHLYSNNGSAGAYEAVVRDADGKYVSGNVELVHDDSKHWLRYYCVREDCPSKNSGQGFPASTDQTHTAASFSHDIACGTTAPCAHEETLTRSGHSVTLTCGYTPTTTWAHTPGGSIIRVDYPEGANPCLTPGVAIYLCANCGEECEGEAYPARGHLWSGTQTLKFPTYDEAGEGYAYCVRCAATEDRSLPQLQRENAVVSISGESSLPWTGSAVSCGHNSDADTFSFTHALASDGSASLLDADDARLITTVEWYSGETKLDAAPSELGSYTLKISVPQTDAYNEDGSGKYGYNAAAGEKSFSIIKAEQVTPDLTLSTTGPEAAENIAKITGSASASVSTSPYESAELTYTSSNEAVATVNASTGAITLVGAGTADITAAYAETAHYNAASATVTLTVLPLSSEANILSFSVAGNAGTVGDNTVYVYVPYTVSLGSVTPTITISDYAQGVAPASGATVAFAPGEMGIVSQPGTYTYTVTAEDGTMKSYTVTVERALETVTGITEPAVQYIPDGTVDPVSYLNSNYGSTGASLEGGGSTNVSVSWELIGDYVSDPAAENLFLWTATAPYGYNPGYATYSGYKTIINQAVSEIPQGYISDPGTLTLSSNTDENTVTLYLTLTAGTTGTVTYQWQQSVYGGWADLPAYDSSLTLTNMDMGYNGAGYRCVVTNDEGGETAPGVGTIYATPLSVEKGSQDAPDTAEFSAETMLLTGVDSAMEYSLDGVNYIPCGDSSVDLSGSVTGECTISVRYAETDYLNASSAQTVAVTKASAPSVSAVQPTAAGGNGSISGLDDTMEVSADGGSSWTAPADEYASGSYMVRVAASGSTLPSEAVSVTILTRYAVTTSGDTDHYARTDIPESVLAGGSISFTVTPETGYTVTVKVNDVPQAAASTYSVNNISSAVEIGFTVSAKTYKVQFSTSGSTCEAMNVTFGQPYGTLPATTRTAYRFDGWYLENSYENLVESTTTVATAGDHILYAKFTAKATLIPAMDALSVFYDGEGHAISPKFSDGVNTVTDGFTVSYKLKDAGDDTYTTEPPINEGAYTVRFVRAEDDSYAAVKQEMDLLEIKPVEISAAALNATAPAYGAAPGSVTTEDTDYTVTGTAWSPDVESFDYDTAYTVTVTLTAKAHHVFKDGFAAKLNGADTTESLSADKKTATVTYTFPNTEKEKFTVTFKNGTETVDTKTVEKGDTLPVSQFPTVPAKTGYTGAWDVTADITNITENKTVNAVYTAGSYTLSFNSNGGSAVASKSVTYDAAVGELATPERTGYRFDGWFSGETQYTAATVYKVAGNTELTAHWTIETYTISYDLNGGAYAEGVSNPASYTVEDSVALNAPVKTGYTFTGWTGSNGDTPQTAVSIAQGSTGNKSYTANWTEATDTAYKVNHYKQDLGAATYTLAETDNKTGTTGADTAAEAKSYEGFTVQSFEQKPIASDSSTVIDIYYNRNSYKVTYSYTGTVPAGAPALPAEAEYEYGASVTVAAAPTLLGYTFNGWSQTESPFVMHASPVEITGGWTAKGDTPYSVEYYLEKVDGSGYDWDKTTPLTGATGSTAVAPEDSYAGFTVDKSVPGTVASGTIIAVENPEDQLTLKLYYKRCSYKVTYSYTGTVPADASALPGEESHKYGETVTAAAAATAAGYTFSGWTPEYTEDVTVTESSVWKSILNWITGNTSFVMPAGNVRVTGSFRPNLNTPYKVEHKFEKPDGSFEVKYMDNKTGTTDTDTEAAARDEDGFAAGTVTQQKIKGDGSTVVTIEYTRRSYTLTWNAGSGSFAGGQTFTENVKFGAAITAPTEVPTRTGYTFKEWEGLTALDTMPAEAKTYTAVWTANEYLLTYAFTGENVPTGAVVPTAENKATDSTVTLPAVAPVNEGGYTYTFNGWTSSDVTISEGSFTMPAKAVTVSGTWTKSANTNTPYKVEHWLEKVEGGYELSEADTENKTGTTGTNTAAEAKTTYTGFESKSFNQQPIAGDGTTVVKIYYDRKSYAVSYEYTGTVPEGAAALLPASGGYKYGSSVTVAAAPTLTGYTFSGWSRTESPFIMPAEAVKITGSWTARGDTAYKVEYYLEKLDSTDSTLYANYEKDENATDNLTGQTGATATANIKAFDGFAYNASLSTVSAAIKADGSLVLKVYYTRSSYTVTYEYTGDVPEGAPTKPETKSYRYGATVTVAEAPTLAGYTFSGWTPKFTEDASLQGNTFWQRLKNWITGTETFIMPNGNVQITGSFTPAEVKYKVEHYWQDAENPENYTLHETDNLKGVTGTTTKAAAKNYDGFTARSFTQQTIAGDGNTTVKINYNRNIYKLSYQYSGTVPAGAAATLPADSEWRYGQAVTVADNPTLTGYTFSGWDKTTGFTMPIGGATATGTWTANGYTVKFDANGGEGSMADMSMTYDAAAKKLTKNSFTKTGYNFSGWNLDGTHYDDEAAVRNLTAEAGGTVTLKAQWTANTYTVKFDANSGKGSMDDQTMTYDVAANLTANAFTKTGYSFKEWSDGSRTYADKENVINLSAAEGGKITLKAWWTANTYTVTFNDSTADGGTKPENVSATYDTAFTLPENTLTREGYEFDGWALTDGGDVKYADKATVADNLSATQGATITLYPVWSACELIIYGDTDAWGIPMEGDPAATYGPLNAEFRLKDGTTIPAGNMTWSIEDLPDGVSIDEASGVVTIQPGTEKTTLKIKGVQKCGAEATAEIRLINDKLIIRAETSGLHVDKSTMWIDGVPYTPTFHGTVAETVVPNATYHFVTFYSYAGEEYDYCTHMYVWELELDDDEYKSRRVEELDDVMQYQGVSIRVRGIKGMRMFTGVPVDAREDLLGSGLAGYKLLEAGTVVMAGKEDRSIVLSNPSALSGYAYKKGVRDSVFDIKDSLSRYTDTLTNFDYEKCKIDYSFRSYMILEDENGEQIELYGGITSRSISYVAWQNKDVYEPGSDPYNYIWDIINNTGAEEKYGS